jgi:hypothetical protein
MIDDVGTPRFGDWVAEDMRFAAFSLGVAWANSPEPEHHSSSPPRVVAR